MKLKFELKPCGEYPELLYISTDTFDIAIPQGCSLYVLEQALEMLKKVETDDENSQDV